jgi:hypothetical protein
MMEAMMRMRKTMTRTEREVTVKREELMGLKGVVELARMERKRLRKLVLLALNLGQDRESASQGGLCVTVTLGVKDPHLILG